MPQCITGVAVMARIANAPGRRLQRTLRHLSFLARTRPFPQSLLISDAMSKDRQDDGLLVRLVR
jgi:hypothetical protein